MFQKFSGKYRKYGNTKILIDDIFFASKKEAHRYQELKLLEKAGDISELSVQPNFELQSSFRDVKGNHHRAIHYLADFRYIDEHTKRITIEDVKGMKTEVYKIKKKLFLYKFPHLVFLES